MDWEKACKEIRTMNWVVLLALGLAGLFFTNPTFTLGILLGGLIIIGNFHVLQHTIQNAFSPDGVFAAKKKIIIAKYYFRLAILGIIIYILITNGWVNPIALAVGLSTVVFSILNFGIRLMWKTSS